MKKLYYKIISKIVRKHWWINCYKKRKITIDEMAKGRCLICHASIRHPYIDAKCCQHRFDCPCKNDECLIKK